LVDLDVLGGLVVRGLSLEPMEGNPPPRVYETTGGMINSIGLQNLGVRAFVSEKLFALARLRTVVFANVPSYAPKTTRKWCGSWKTTRASPGTS